MFDVVIASSHFFFSSRIRHTSWNCDWSSDVCSSDLVPTVETTVPVAVEASAVVPAVTTPGELAVALGTAPLVALFTALVRRTGRPLLALGTLDVLRSEERRVGKECRARRWLDGYDEV